MFQFWKQAKTSQRVIRDLYLDLLIKVLTNVIYGDQPVTPGPGGSTTYQRQLRQTGNDWPSCAHTMVGIERLTNLRDLTQRALDEGVAGDFIETGVWRGGCCILLRGVLKANDERNRKVYVADSFGGLPPPNPDRYPQDAGDQHHTFRQLAVSLDQVKANFAAYDLLDDQVAFLPGLFQDTLPKLKDERFALIRLDGDMYESTIVALNHLYPRLSRGGFVIIDDYGAIAQCKAAVTDFRQWRGITAPMHTVDWTGVWWQKT